MMFSRLDILSAFLTCDILKLMIGLLGCNLINCEGSFSWNCATNWNYVFQVPGI